MVETTGTEEQMQQVIQFLDSKEARGQALEIILGYTSTVEHREMFVGKELTKKLLRLVIEPEMKQPEKTSVFQILINIVQDKVFAEECVKLNAARKVFDFLMNNVKQDIQETGTDAKLVNY